MKLRSSGRDKMRQPRFRGFCLETNQWHYGYGWFKSDYTEEYKQEKGIKDTANLYTDDYPVECELCSMGEYTWKKVTGKEVYEGDIVETVYDGKTFVGVVVYDLDELGFKATNGKENYGTNFQYLTCCNEIEIIGKTYKNPELLSA